MKLSVFSLFLALAVVAVTVIGSLPVQPGSNLAVDISWPNCGVTPPGDSVWGIVGVTGGLDFRPNPCLAQESHWFTHLSLYVNTGYPGEAYGKKFSSSPKRCPTGASHCLAYNYGYNATLYAINYAKKEAVQSPLWWLDVESDNSWTANYEVNRASLEGAIDALKQHVFLPIIGFYSYPGQWDLITGRWHNQLPSWTATGSTSALVAEQACKGQSFTGSLNWLGQYTSGLDKNSICGSQFTKSLNRL